MLVHETKNWLALVAILIATLAYIPYFRDIFKGRTKPHAFTWLVWCVMSTVAFFSQVSDAGGAGTWVLAYTAIIDFAIFSLALYKGETKINTVDWFCLFGAFIGVAMFTFYQDPPMSVIIISAVDLIGFVPTVRKSLLRPQHETATTFALTSLKYVTSIVALENYTLITTLYPATVGTTNLLFAFLLLYQRNKLGYGVKRRTEKLRMRKKTTKAARKTIVKTA